ncbi:hypothetical protein ACHAPU_000921 [Fusarium lateritium]
MIVCPQSPVINAALSGGFQEATSKVLIVKEFDISTVRYMVSFLYTGEYQIDLSNEARRNPIEEQYLQDFDQSDVGPENETVETLLAHSRINAIADYYDIENLAQLAISKFQGIIESGPDVEISPRIIQEVSTSNTNPDLQISVASFAAARIEDLCKLPAFRELEIEHSLAKKILHGCGLTKSVLKDTLQANQQQVAAYQDLLARESRKNELLEGMINRISAVVMELLGLGKPYLTICAAKAVSAGILEASVRIPSQYLEETMYGLDRRNYGDFSVATGNDYECERQEV